MRFDIGNWFGLNKNYTRRRYNSLPPYPSQLTPPVTTEVDFIRPELEHIMLQYEKIRDCLEGEDYVKSLREKYLPDPSPDIKDEQSIERYRNYVNRAIFLNTTGFTQRTTIGKLFTKPATLSLPPLLSAMRYNVNGEGLEFDQLIERVAGEVFAFGRGGLYADFKTLSESDSIADVENVTPTLHFVKPEDITNWRIDTETKKLILVVVKEFYEEYEGFAVRIYPQYRAFILGDTLRVEIWRPRPAETYSLDKHEYIKVREYYPMLPGGRPWTEIPFAIIGANNNDWIIDPAPLYSMATLDFAMYRNSADYEEAGHYIGQPTPYIAGVKADWVRQFKLNKWRWGSGRIIPLHDAAAKVGLVQAKAETLLDKLVKNKEEKIRQMGGTLFSVDSLSEDQTATGAVYQALKLHAPLITTSRNVVAGFKKALGYAAMFVGIDPESEEIDVRLNSEILDSPLGVTGLRVVLELWRAGLITFDEAREQARIQGLTIHTTEEAETLLQNEVIEPRTFAHGEQVISGSGVEPIQENIQPEATSAEEAE